MMLAAQFEQTTPGEILAAIMCERGDLVADVWVGAVFLVAFLLHRSGLFNFKLLVDLVAYDRPSFHNRFVLTYLVASTRFASRMRLRTAMGALVAVGSLFALYANVYWPEREISDMFGVLVLGIALLGHILCDYGFPGFPLLKDFPMFGDVSSAYSQCSEMTSNSFKGLLETATENLTGVVSTVSFNVELLDTLNLFY